MIFKEDRLGGRVRDKIRKGTFKSMSYAGIRYLNYGVSIVYLVLVLVIKELEIWHKGSNMSSVMSPMVDEAVPCFVFPSVRGHCWVTGRASCPSNQPVPLTVYTRI